MTYNELRDYLNEVVHKECSYEIYQTLINAVDELCDIEFVDFADVYENHHIIIDDEAITDYEGEEFIAVEHLKNVLQPKISEADKLKIKLVDTIIERSNEPGVRMSDVNEEMQLIRHIQELEGK